MNSQGLKAPGPSAFEVVKSLPLIVGDRLAWMTDVQKKHGDIVRIPLGPRAVYAVFHPDFLRHVLVVNAKNYWKGRTFEKTASYMGKGLATTEGAEWQVQRRRMNPHFHKDALKSITTILSDNIELTMDRWKAFAKTGEVIDLATEFQRLAMESIARALFGTGVPQEKIHSIIEAFKVSLQFTTSRTLNPFDIPESLPIPSNIRFKKAVGVMDETVYGMIRAERARTEPSRTLLSVLVRASDPETGEAMSDQQVRDEVMTMFLGGTDTSGNTLSWTFYNLDRHPEVRTKSLEEIKKVLGNRRAEHADLDSLNYIERTIDETLRLFPQNWVGSRDAYGDDVIGGYHIPAGSTVFLGVYRAHRHLDFWRESERFDPDRFLPENSAGRHPMSYMPFGAGPRKCIGFQFAMMELKLAISRILQRYEVTLVAPEKIRRYATWSLWPKPGVFAKLREI